MVGLNLLKQMFNLGDSRRICNRWENKSTNFAAFVKLATIMILAKNYFRYAF